MARKLNRHQKAMRNAKRRRLARQSSKTEQPVASTSEGPETPKSPGDAVPGVGAQVPAVVRAESGLLLSDEHQLGRDVRVIGRAARNRWNLGDRLRDELLDEMVPLVRDRNMDPKVRVAAFKAIVSADNSDHQRDKLDVARSQQAKPQEIHQTREDLLGTVEERAARIDAIAALLGLGESLADATQRRAASIDVRPVGGATDADGDGQGGPAENSGEQRPGAPGRDPVASQRRRD